MENLASVVGKNLTALRKAKGMTQIQLATEIHYSDKSISKWENGYALPSVDILADFAAYYGVTVDYLITEQSKQTITETVEKEEQRSSPNKIIVCAMAATLIIFGAILILISSFLNNLQGGAHNMHYWPVLTWAASITFFVEGILCWRFFHRRWIVIVMFSLFGWFLIGSFAFHFWWMDGREVWYVLSAAIPYQVILVLALNWKRPMHKAKAVEPPKEENNEEKAS